MIPEYDLVIAHKDCPDGFCCLWVAHRMLGNNAKYITAQYRNLPPRDAAKRILIADFSWPKDALLKLAEKNKQVVVLDHHKTAQADLDGVEHENLTVIFDMDKSGGRLTWEHFHGFAISPWLVDYTEDRDLWRWKLKDTVEINSALSSFPRKFEVWDSLAREGITPYLVQQGKGIHRFKVTLVAEICDKAEDVIIGGYCVRAANTVVLISEVANRLSQGKPFGVAWCKGRENSFVFSLRSQKDGLDVSEIAKQYGGGGHKHAAGFVSKNPPEAVAL